MSTPTHGQPQPPHHQQYPPQQPYPAGYAPIQQPPKKKAKKWPWIVGAIVLLIVIGGVLGGGKQPATNTPAAGSTSTQQTAAQPPAATQPAAPAKRTVVYEVTGAGQANSITYVVDGLTSTEQVGQVPLPWSKTIELKAGEAFQMVSIFAQAGQGTPEITAKITVDGKVVKDGKSSGTYAVVNINENIGSLK